MKLILTGDSFITRRVPADDPVQKAFRDWFETADVRFTNLEVTTHKEEGYPAPVSGGTWAMADPGVLDDLLGYGFNVMNWANNHTLDYLHGGLLATERELNRRAVVHGGAGESLHSASQPRYLETVNGRVALIGATSTYSPGWEAEDGNRYIGARPGVNMLRAVNELEVTAEDYAVLKRIAAETNLNADQELLIKEGFEVGGKEESVTVGAFCFKEGKKTSRVRHPDPRDIARLIHAVTEAKRQADLVCVSLHSHEMTGMEKNKAADFLEEASRALIDAGADVIIGHGPHILRGIELYKGKPIFHSLGNFIFQNDAVTALPKAFFDKYELSEKATIADAFDARSDGGRRGLGVNPDVWESVVAELDWQNGQLQKIRCHPVSLGKDEPRYRRGTPKPAEDEEKRILEELARLSKSYGTRINTKTGEVSLD